MSATRTELARRWFYARYVDGEPLGTDPAYFSDAWWDCQRFAAEGIVWLATLPEDGPTGRFFRFGTEAEAAAATFVGAEVPW